MLRFFKLALRILRYSRILSILDNLRQLITKPRSYATFDPRPLPLSDSRSENTLFPIKKFQRFPVALLMNVLSFVFECSLKGKHKDLWIVLF